MKTMAERMIEFFQDRMNAKRLGVFMNRKYLVDHYGIKAIPRLFTAANQRLTKHDLSAAKEMWEWKSGGLYKWGQRKVMQS